MLPLHEARGPLPAGPGLPERLQRHGRRAAPRKAPHCEIFDGKKPAPSAEEAQVVADAGTRVFDGALSEAAGADPLRTAKLRINFMDGIGGGVFEVLLDTAICDGTSVM